MRAKRNVRSIAGTCVRSTATTVTAAAVLFAITVSAPVTIDFNATGLDLVASKTAAAKNSNAGDNGGGNGNGNNGNGNNGNGNNGNGNSGNGNSDNGNNGNGNNGAASNGTSAANTPASSQGGEYNNIIFAPIAPKVLMALFTTMIRQRYPVNNVAVLDDPHQAVSFFTELQAMAGRKITHRWIHNGSVKFSASFDVKAKDWRTWSTQLLPADMPGKWVVELVDEDGNVLETRALIYRPMGAGKVAQR